MSDIDQIIAGGAKTNADFSAIGNLSDAFFNGAKQRADFDQRRAFRDGVPTDENGQPDFGAMAKTLFQKGDYGQGIAAANLDLQRQQLKFGQQQSGAITGFEGGQPPAQSPPIVSPPSVNRSGSTPVAPPLNRGGVQNGQNGSPHGDQPGSIVGLVSAAGIPDDKAGPVILNLSKAAGIDPNASVPAGMLPRIQGALQSFLGRTGGQGAPPPQAAPQAPVVQGAAGPQPVPGQPVPGSSAPIQPTPVPTQAITQGQPAPVTNAVTGTTAPAVPSRIDQAITFYSGIMSNPISPKSNIDLAKTRLESLQKNTELTPEQKNFIQAKLEGFPGSMADFAVKTEADKTYATENAKSYIKKYDTIQTAGERARVDLPQLDLARKLTEDPNFYSGTGEKYNLLVKRAVVALGGDPNTAAPQEAFRKIVSNSILDQIKAMAGTGPIRVAEMKIMQDAAANPDNTPQSNRLLLELSSRLQKRSADIADMAQTYNGGRLDAGFDRKIAAYDRANPMISDKEIPNFRKIIDSGAQSSPSSQPKFNAPSDVRAAVAAGKLKTGDAFTDATGKTRYVP